MKRLLCLTAVLACSAGSFWAQGVTSLASESASYFAGDGESHGATLSADGRFLVFMSRASNLVFGDFNGMPDVFVLDRQTGALELISKSWTGGAANSASGGGTITSDGRFVSFYSEATNIVPDDENGVGDGFVYDRLTGSTRLVTYKSNGEQVTVSTGAQISLDGKFVVFATLEPGIVAEDDDELRDVFTRNIETGVVTLQSVGFDGSNVNGHCDWPVISTSGRYVAFASHASNLVPGDDPWFLDVFVRDTLMNHTIKVTRAHDGGIANDESNFATFSADERFLALSSLASNLVPVDTNGAPDVFVYDVALGIISIESISTNGEQGNAYSVHPSLSGDGRYVVMHSGASNLVAGDNNFRADIFLRDRQQRVTTLITHTPGEQQADLSATYPRISQNGRIVTFSSDDGNLAPNDFNHVSDAFEHDVLASAVTPNMTTLVRGSRLSGGLKELRLRDNLHLRLAPNGVSDRGFPIDLVVESQTSILNPAQIIFNFDGSATSNRVLAYISLYNYQTQSYDQATVKLMGPIDKSIVHKVLNDAGRYVSPSGEIRARIQLKISWGAALGWSVSADQIRWVIAP